MVQRLLRGESLEAVSREENVPVHRMTEWRDKVLLGAESALKERERDGRDDEIAPCLKPAEGGSGHQVKALAEAF